MIDTSTVIQSYADTFDTSVLGMETLEKLRALFLAIKKLPPETPEITVLADIGVYIADDVHNMLDCTREEAEKKRQDINRRMIE